MVASIKDWWKKQDTDVSTDPSSPRSTGEFQMNAEGDDLVDRTQNLQGTPSSVPTHDEIEARAYLIYERSGRQAGRCEKNWLQAEKEQMEEKRNGVGMDGSAQAGDIKRNASQSVAESEF